MSEIMNEFRRRTSNPKIILLRFSFLKHEMIDVIADIEFVQPFSRWLPGKSSYQLVKAEELSNLSSSLFWNFQLQPFPLSLLIFFPSFFRQDHSLFFPCFPLIIIVSQRTHVMITTLMINTV